MAFAGFPKAGIGFLGELAERNDRAWFAENRERYERDLLGPEREFVDAVGAAFAAVDQRVQAVPAIDRSIFRINRDTRFSRDKSPYKTYSDLWFWIGDDRKSSPGYFLRLTADEIWVGCGAHNVTPEQLARYRVAVVDGVQGPWLEHVLADLVAAGYELGDQTLKRVPAGFDAQSPRAELLRYTRLHAIRVFAPPPQEVYSAEFVQWCMGYFLETKPLVDWLVEHLSGVNPPDMRL